MAANTETKKAHTVAAAVSPPGGDSSFREAALIPATGEWDEPDSAANGADLAEPDGRLTMSLQLHCVLRIPPVDDAV